MTGSYERGADVDYIMGLVNIEKYTQNHAR